MLAAAGYDGELSVTDELDRALDGASFVLIQLRVGGQTARLSDETLPLACGCIGQETTGAGGLGKALRTVPVVLGIAERARELAARRRLDRRFHESGRDRRTRRCSTPDIARSGSATSRSGSSVTSLPCSESSRTGCSSTRSASTTSPGCARFTSTAATSCRTPAQHGDELAEGAGLPRDVLDRLGAIPSYYLHYFYLHDQVLEEQREGKPRAAEVAEIERELLELYRDPTLTTKPPLLEQRGGAYYSDAATQLVASLATGDGDVQVVDVRNNGTLEGLADDDVVEVPARIEAGGPIPIEQAPLAPELLGLVQHVAAYERLAAGRR